MKDPYSILGVSRDATNDEIKKAYRALCRKYHPDLNPDNPQAAEEKFKQIGEAYRTVMDERSGKQKSYSDFEDSASSQDPTLRAAAVYIQRGYFREALNTLNSSSVRTALWYYLSAVANARLSNTIIAREHARTAVSMEPDNLQYRRLYSTLNGESGFYRDYTTRGETYGRYMHIDSTACVRCCAANIAVNLCCGGRFFCC